MALPRISTDRALLRRLAPVGLLLGAFLAPFVAFLDVKSLDLPGPSPDGVQAAGPGPRGSPGPVPGFDAFRTRGAFAISQADADRAGWTWSRAKDLASEVWEDQIPGRGQVSGFYCGCRIDRRGATGGDVDLASCGLAPRSNATRAARLEWEHVVPAATIGRGRSCWSRGAPQCVDKAGTPYKGRSCCMIADPAFAMAATDPVNLVPSSGEVNGDRLDFAYGLVEGEPRAYGQCDMEIDREQEIAEPPPARRGDVARIWAYMSKAYGLSLDPDQARLYRDWILADPVSREEIDINRAISRSGHRPNPFVLNPQR